MSILLRGGTLLLHDSKEHIIPTKSDLLIIGNTITEISPHISPPKGTEVIDCTDKIVSPGFIDTHRHLWQTPLKGRHANELLLGNPSPIFPPFPSRLYCYEIGVLGLIDGRLYANRKYGSKSLLPPRHLLGHPLRLSRIPRFRNHNRHRPRPHELLPRAQLPRPRWRSRQRYALRLVLLCS